MKRGRTVLTEQERGVIWLLDLVAVSQPWPLQRRVHFPGTSFEHCCTVSKGLPGLTIMAFLLNERMAAVWPCS